MIEIWRNIKGYGGFYQVSNFGRVKNILSNLILKQSISNTGYAMVGLSKNNIPKRFTVHRLVALHFIENADESLQVNHKDGHKLNNHINNLELVTASENCLHATRTLGRETKTSFVKGGGHPCSKAVTMKNLQNEKIKEFKSISLAVEHLKNIGYSKACSTAISKCCKETHRYAYGFRWEYKRAIKVVEREDL